MTKASDPFANLVHTYSIAARDPESGQMGVAVQSHYFSVGPMCPWAEAGVGAVATQSFVDPGYGPLGLELMKAGKSAEEALRGLLAADELAHRRQVAMIDADGGVSAHTGASCIAEAGHRIGDGYSVQANMMLNNTVWDAMAEAFESTGGSLAARMLGALVAAEKEGGDIRGRQSAAMLIVNREATGKPWTDRFLDLRVEDHNEPLEEMQRLLSMHESYARAREISARIYQGDDLEAASADVLVMQAEGATNEELDFWFGVSLIAAGKDSDAKKTLDKVFASNSNWSVLLRRLPAAGLLEIEETRLELFALPPSS